MFGLCDLKLPLIFLLSMSPLLFKTTPVGSSKNLLESGFQSEFDVLTNLESRRDNKQLSSVKIGLCASRYRLRQLKTSDSVG